MLVPFRASRLFLVLLTLAVRPATAAEDTIDFSRDVLPILSANCFACHGRDPSTREAELRLDVRDSATTTRNGFTPLVPGQPLASEIIARVTSAHEDERMPPADKGRALHPGEIATLKRWIEQGAPYTEHWAFLPPKRAALPPVKDQAWAKSPLDHFVLSRLEAEKLQPAPHASREALLRRATLDLIGLPPRPEEMAAFLADPSPNAFAQVVERLLASPHYGERWGRHWLDVARYADSGGFETDIFFGHAWRYRDYVIKSLNADKPFNLFLKEQIAGDELFPGNEQARIATGLYTTGPVLQEAGMVTGKLEYDQNTDFVDTTGSAFLGLTLACARCHDHKYDPISQKEYYSLQAIFAASDQVDFAADGTQLRDRAALKNTQKEFEAEQARDRAHRESDPAKRAELLRKTGDAYIEADPQLKYRVDVTRRYDTIAKEIARYTEAAAGKPIDFTVADELESDQDDANDVIALKAVLLGLRNELKGAPPEAALLNVGAVVLLNPAPRPPVGRSSNRAAAESPNAPAASPAVSAAASAAPPRGNAGAVSPRRAFNALTEAAGKRAFLLDLGRQQLSRSKPDEYVADIAALRFETGEKHLNDPSPIPFRFLAHKEKVPEVRIFKRGELEMPGDVVEPALPEKLAGGRSLDGVAANRRRAALAEWIASDRHLLTARVIVNRVWQWHFGEGLVRTPNDFGIRGDVPSHPELLDWLAAEFVGSGWSLKKLHRLIMNSGTYQMSATADPATLDRDPDNRLLTRYQPFRLQAEVIWDNIRAAAGTIDLTMFGLPIAPPLDDQEQLGNYRKWPVSTPEESNRRAIYILVKRSFRFPMLSAFDLPDNISSCGRRDITTVPSQALTLLNNGTMREQAAAFATRLLRETNGDESLVSARAWLHAYGRTISPDERAQTLDFLQYRRAGGDLRTALTELCLAIFNTNEFIYQQ